MECFIETGNKSQLTETNGNAWEKPVSSIRICAAAYDDELFYLSNGQLYSMGIP